MKKVKIFILILIVFNILSLNIYAFDLGQMLTGAKTFLDGAVASTGNVDASFSGLIQGFAQAGLAIGTIIAIVAGIVIAMKFMANGAEGKAEMKAELTPYLIGCVVLFGAFTIWTIVVNIMQNTF